MKNGLIKIDYNNCLVNLASSILKEFNVTNIKNKSLPQIDKILSAKSYKNIVILLIDGMGTNIIDKNLSPNGFFAKNMVDTISSVYPPTTVAATTSINTGLYPCEHNWLGWDCYYKEIDKNVTVFSSKEQGTDKPAAEYNVPWTYCPYESIIDKINNTNNKAYVVSKFVEPYPTNIDSICDRINELCKEDGKKYIYSYYPYIDSLMHEKGIEHADVKLLINEVEEKVKTLCNGLEDTLFIVTADHGHIDNKCVAIENYPTIMKCLVRPLSIEPRTPNFYIKDGYKDIFESEFNKEFGKDFILLNKKEVREYQIFGPGEEHTYFDSSIGDYVALAIGDVAIFNTTEESKQFIGVHAGMTNDELNIPLIVYESR